MFKIFLFLVIVGIGYGIYRAICAHKRSLTLTVGNPIVSPGTPIQCTIVLENQKMIRSNEVTLTLVGMGKVRETGKGLVNAEIHRSRHVVVAQKTYPPKNRSEYAFEVPTPIPRSGGTSAFASSIAEEIKSQGTGRKTEWHIEACLDGNGVTLTDSQPVTIGDAGAVDADLG